MGYVKSITLSGLLMYVIQYESEKRQRDREAERERERERGCLATWPLMKCGLKSVGSI